VLLRLFDSDLYLSNLPEAFTPRSYRWGSARAGKFELVDEGPMVTLRSSKGSRLARKIPSDRGFVLQLDNEEYEVINVKETRTRLAKAVRKYINRHYGLGPVQQRRYLVGSFNQLLSYLFVEGHLTAIPESLNDFLALMPIAIRRLRATWGLDLNFNIAAHRRALFTEIQNTIHEATETGDLGDDDNWFEKHGGEICKSCSFVHFMNSDFKLEYSTTAEEILDAVMRLQCVDRGALHDFFSKCLDAISEEEDAAGPSPLVVDDQDANMGVATGDIGLTHTVGVPIGKTLLRPLQVYPMPPTDAPPPEVSLARWQEPREIREPYRNRPVKVRVMPRPSNRPLLRHENTRLELL